MGLKHIKTPIGLWAKSRNGGKYVGGFWEYPMLSNRLLHLTMPLKIGAIHLEIDDYENPNDWDNYESYLFSVEHQLFVEINLHKYARFFIGGGYRFVGNELYSNGGFIPAHGNAISLGFQL